MQAWTFIFFYFLREFQWYGIRNTPYYFQQIYKTDWSSHYMSTESSLHLQVNQKYDFIAEMV